ncbi:MAG: riboflavin synthase [Deltaproteobacteria bacterium]|nr:riboflavin synthase [Deltaproteobacteria bacterium]
MFTGIIHTLGKVKGLEKKDKSARITIEHSGLAGVTPHTKAFGMGVNIGDSIAVDGVCLTIVEFFPAIFTADVSEETLKFTTLGGLRRGAVVNLEKSLTPSTPIGGHFVAGHIDGVGFIAKKTADGEFAILDFTLPNKLQSQIVKKGSVAVDGISLTVADIIDNGFRVAIIPYTLKNTNLSLRKEGDKVNIETDIIAKYVERFLVPYKKKGVEEAFLKEHGFTKG